MSRSMVFTLAFALTSITHADAQKLDAYGDALPPGAIARLGQARWRVGNGAHVLHFQPDGTLLTISDDLMGQVWDVKTGKELRDIDYRAALPAEAGRIFSMQSQYPGSRPIALSGNGKLLAVAGMDEMVHFLEAPSGKYLRVVAPVSSTGPLLALSRDGSRLAELGAGMSSVERPQTMGTIFDTTGSASPQRLMTSDWTFYSGADFSADGKSLIRTGLKFDFKNNNKTESLIGTWDTVHGGDMRRTALTDQPEDGAAVPVVSPDRQLVAVPLRDSIRMLRLADGKEIARMARTPDAWHPRYVFTSDGKSFISTLGPGKPLTIWEASSGRILKQFGKAEEVTTQFSFFVAPAILPDGKTLVWADRPAISLIDLESGNVRNEIAGHTGPLREALFSPDGREVMTRSTDGKIIRWDPETGRSVGQWVAPSPTTTSCQVTSDRRWVLVFNVPAGGVTVYDGATMKELRRISTQQYPYSWGVVPNSKCVAFGYRGSRVVTIHDIETAEKVFEAPLPVVPAIPDLEGGTHERRRVTTAGMPNNREFFSRDGRLMGIASEGFVTVWNLTTRRRLLQFSRDGLGVFRAGDLSVDGCLLALDSIAGVSVWEISTGAKRLTLAPREDVRPEDVTLATTLSLSGGLAFPTSMVLSPDGRLLARAGDDRSIRVWDLWTGTELGRFTGYRGTIVSLAFSPDGRRLVSASTDSTALVWDLDPLRAKLAKSWSKIGDSADALWQTLLDRDAEKAFTAMRTLAGDPAAAVALLKSRLKRAEPPDPKVVEKLIADLNNPKFAAREKAQRELEQLGEQAAPALRRVATSDSPEAQRAAKRLLERLEQVKLTPEQLRAVRAVEVLERIATPEAVAVLRTLATGADEVAPTPQARGALQRLK